MPIRPNFSPMDKIIVRSPNMINRTIIIADFCANLNAIERLFCPSDQILVRRALELPHFLAKKLIIASVKGEELICSGKDRRCPLLIDWDPLLL